MIEISIAHDKIFNQLSEFAQLLYLKILPHTDDYGRFEGDPEILKVRVDPFSKRKIKDYISTIKEIADLGLWIWYLTDDNKAVVQYNESAFCRINAFLIKKRGKPEFPEYIDSYKSISNDIGLLSSINNSKYKVISRKQQVESNKIDEEKFNKFWVIYPRKASKQEAIKSFCKLDPDEDLLNIILSDIENKRKSTDWNKDGGQYIPHPSTYLNKKRWEDKIETKGQVF